MKLRRRDSESAGVTEREMPRGDHRVKLVSARVSCIGYVQANVRVHVRTVAEGEADSEL